MMIMASTSSMVTSSLLTVPTNFPCSMTLIRSARSNTSWMSWLIRKMPIPSCLELRDQLRHLGGLGRTQRSGGLIHDEDSGIEMDRSSNRHRLTLATGQRSHRNLEVQEFGIEAAHDLPGGVLHGRIVE